MSTRIYTKSDIYIHDGKSFVPFGDVANCCFEYVADMGVPDEFAVSDEIVPLTYTATFTRRVPHNVLKHRLYELVRKCEGRDKRWARRQRRSER